jgi:hypothetical protein
MRCTITEALRDMRRLHDVDAGRLRGETVYLSGYTADQPAPAAPQPWADHLKRLIAAGRAGTITPDTPRYVVYSDNTAVAWLTVHAQVLAPPDMALTANQTKHQRQAAQVLSDLDRGALRDLADDRQRREGHPEVADAEYDAGDGMLRVAPADDPTRTTWIPVDPDPAATRARAARALRLGPDHDVIVISAWGFGQHCARVHRLDLGLLCTIHAVAAAHGVDATTVGNWIAHEDGLAGPVDPTTLPTLFQAAYVGRYPDRDAYARARMDELGWTTAIAELGIEAYFNHDAHQRDVFRYEAIAIDPGEYHRRDRGIQVFHRQPHWAGAHQ